MGSEKSNQDDQGYGTASTRGETTTIRAVHLTNQTTKGGYDGGL